MSKTLKIKDIEKMKKKFDLENKVEPSHKETHSDFLNPSDDKKIKGVDNGIDIDEDDLDSEEIEKDIN